MRRGVIAMVGSVAAGLFNAAAAGDDGCDILEERVRMSVRAAVTGHRTGGLAAASRDRAGAIGSVFAGKLVCANTTAAVTGAFSEALGTLDMAVAWNDQPPRDGGPCPSHDLRQCYPSPYPVAPAISPHRLALAHLAWHGVREAVASQMPFGPEAGMSEFTVDVLDLALASKLDAAADARFASR